MSKVLPEVHERREEKFYKTAIAKKYNIATSTLTGFISNEIKIGEEFAKNKNRKRARDPGLLQVDEVVLMWFSDAWNNHQNWWDDDQNKSWGIRKQTGKSWI